MKKIIALILIISLAFCTSCSPKVPENTIKTQLYFSNSASDNLVTEVAYVPAGNRENTVEFVRVIMSKLLDGPLVEGNKRVIPEGVYLRGVSLEPGQDGVVNIDLSKEYYQNIQEDALASEELLARYSIVCTLCQFDEIKKIKFYVDGKDMMASSGDGEVLSAMGLGSVMVNSPSSVETQTEKFVTLYFTDKIGIKLYPETHKATMTDNSLEKTVVNELIRGPVSNEFERTFPESTQLISAETTEGVCFVNFSGDFVAKIDDARREKTAVYSVVNSLTRLPGIEKVQILVDGKKPENDTQQLFSMPLERDESMIVNIK